MFAIKVLPEDFFVEEVPDRNWLDNGSFLVLRVLKRDWNTESATDFIAKRLSIKRSLIKYAGAKDKRAVTVQYMSIKGFKKKVFFKHNGLFVESVGFTNEPLSLGSLKGNNFVIVVRRIKEGASKINNNLFPNFFDSQRFSSNNADVGLAIIKKDFKLACDLLKGESSVSNYLLRNPNDFCGALRTINDKILSFYIHAYQSRLFNIVLEELLRDNDVFELENFKIPLVGFGSENSELVDKMLAVDNISLRDFIIREIPNISSEGSYRSAVVRVDNIYFSDVMDDDLNPGFKKQTIAFFLPKGSYATVIIKSLFS